MRNSWCVAGVVLLGISLGWPIFGRLREHPPEMLDIEPVEHDFGSTRPSVVSCAYTLTNHLSTDVEILGVIKSCGCTNAQLDSTRVKKCERATAHCSFDLHGRVGDFATYITIVYRQADNPNAEPRSVRCGALAKVDPIVHVTPDSLVFNEGRAGVRKLSVVISDRVSHVVCAEADHKAFTTTLNNSMGEVLVAFDPTRWAAGNGTPVVLITTTCPHEEKIRVPLQVVNASATVAEH